MGKFDTLSALVYLDLEGGDYVVWDRVSNSNGTATEKILTFSGIWATREVKHASHAKTAKSVKPPPPEDSEGRKKRKKRKQD